MGKKRHRRLKKCASCSHDALAQEMLNGGIITMIQLPWSPGESQVAFTGDPATLPLVPCFDAVRQRFPKNLCRHGVRVALHGPRETCVEIIEAVIVEAKRTLTDEHQIKKAEAYRVMVQPQAYPAGRRITIQVRVDREHRGDAQVATDPLFEGFIAAESEGVRDSARMMYYGESYDMLYTPVVTNPIPRPPIRWPIMHSTHTDEENQRASHLVDVFSDQHPNRAERYGYQMSGFEDALRKAFPGRKDIQDCARLHFYPDSDPQVDSYESISNEELDQIRVFLARQRGRV